MAMSRAALFQMTSGISPEVNAAAIVNAAREAGAGGAAMLFTPEMSGLLDRKRERAAENIVIEAEDRVLAAAREAAAREGIWMHIGSLAVRPDGEGGDARYANRAFVIDDNGEIRARYDKIHMFDVDLPNGDVYRESEAYRPGELAVAADLPDIRLGLTICYDLRFPALFRALAEAGAGMIAVPAAFTQPTGEAHWHILLRARAIETGSYVLAAAQCGTHENGRRTFGHSLIIDPWGTILAEAGTEPGFITAEIDPAKVKAVRSRIPSLENGRRFELVTPAEESHLHLVPSGDVA